MNRPTAVILAAGEGTRMRSQTPKVLHNLCGRPLLQWVIAAAKSCGVGKVVVVDGPERALEQHLGSDASIAIQEQRLGTADALRSASHLIETDAPVLVLNGDVPLVSADLLRDLLETHTQLNAAATMATIELGDPSGYGRVVRDADGNVERVVETKNPADATDAELAIREVNTGIFVFQGGLLVDALKHLKADNAQKEFYLPDTLPELHAQGHKIHGHLVADSLSMLGINNRVDLAQVQMIAQNRIHESHQLAGVTISDPFSTTIDVDVEIGVDSIIAPGTSLRGKTKIGSCCTVGPHSTITDSSIGDHSTVVHSYLDQATVEQEVRVGPFTYLRPGTVLMNQTKAGAFVEIKNSTVATGAKVPHLSYIGDAEIGEKSNIGAGTITANYDGHRKHRTVIGKRAHVGVDTALVAPVTIGDDAYTGAGSVIVQDVPAGSLGIARERQSNIDGYTERITQNSHAGKIDT